MVLPTDLLASAKDMDPLMDSPDLALDTALPMDHSVSARDTDPPMASPGPALDTALPMDHLDSAKDTDPPMYPLDPTSDTDLPTDPLSRVMVLPTVLPATDMLPLTFLQAPATVTAVPPSSVVRPMATDVPAPSIAGPATAAATTAIVPATAARCLYPLRSLLSSLSRKLIND